MLRPASLRTVILAAAFAFAGNALCQEEPRLDIYGDPLPPGAVARLGTMRLQATGGFCWMPDGKSLATACAGRIWFWDAADGRPIKSLPALGNTDTNHYYLAVSQDGSKLVCAEDRGDVSIHDLKSGKDLTRPRQRGSADPNLESPNVGALAIAPDGTSFVTANYQQNVRLWDTTTGEVLLHLPVDTKVMEYPCVAYSPDSRYVAYGCGTTIRLFDLENPATPLVFQDAHGQESNGLAFTPDGKSLISIGTSKYESKMRKGGERYLTNHCEVRVWNVVEMRLQHELTFPERMGGMGLMALAPDGKTLVTMHRETSLVWDLEKRSVVRRLPPHSTRYTRLGMKAAIDASGKYLAFDSSETHLRVWDLETGTDLFPPEKRHNKLITAVAWSPDGKLAATGDGRGGIRLWDADSGEIVRTLPDDYGWIRGLEFSNDSSRLFAGAEGFDEKELKYIGKLKAFRVSDGALTFDTSLPGRVVAIALSRDGGKIAVSSGLGAARLEPRSDPMVHVCDASSGKNLDVWKVGEGKVTALSWSKDNRFLVIAAEDNTVRTIDTHDGKQTTQVEVPHERVKKGEVISDHLHQALLLPDRERAITCTLFGNSIHRWDIKRGAQIWTLTTPGMNDIALSPDERVLASAWFNFERQQSGLALWEVATRKPLLELSTPTDQVYSIAFSPDGRRIITGLETGSALVWDVSAAWQQLSSVER